MPNDRLTSKQACWKKIRHQQNIKKTIRSDNKVDVKGKKNKMLPGKMPIRNRNHCGLDNQNPKTASKIKAEKKDTQCFEIYS